LAPNLVQIWYTQCTGDKDDERNIMTDKELWQAAWKELTLTTISYPRWEKQNFNSGHWANAKALGDQIGAVVPPPPPPPPPPPATSSLYNVGPFGSLAPDWNDSTKWDASSPTLVNTLKAGVSSSNIAISGYGVAIFYVKTTDPTVSLTNTNNWGNAPSGTTFKCPSIAVPAKGTDGHLTLVQPDGSLVEMWKAVRNGSNWICGAAGVSPAGAHGYSSAACRGSSFTLPAGLVDPVEVANGSIEHALSVVISASIIRKAYVDPSNDTDGEQVGTQFIPEGARICLNPSADISGMSGLEFVLAKALQRYGAFLVDRTSGPEFSILAVAPETWTALGQPDKWAGLGYTDYPQFPKIAALMGQMKVAKFVNLRLK
jgi:hypothetical protein